MIDAVTVFPIWLVLALAAPFLGSFLGVLAMRLPHEQPVLMDRSRCPECSHVLRPVDLIPIVSWINLRARCRHCGSPISCFYPAIEIAALFIVLWSASVASGAALIASSVLGWLLLALAVIDWRTICCRMP